MICKQVCRYDHPVEINVSTSCHGVNSTEDDFGVALHRNRSRARMRHVCDGVTVLGGEIARRVEFQAMSVPLAHAGLLIEVHASTALCMLRYTTVLG